MTRPEIFGNYIITHNSTIRETAQVYNISKSTVHLDVSHRLKSVDKTLYDKVKIVLQHNFDERHIRGGLATKLKYQK